MKAGEQAGGAAVEGESMEPLFSERNIDLGYPKPI